ncbi:MAG: molybdopterin-dependent oxidoreductase [Deltaproteobacteria bacterium]|nr:molybdopterin-dependent oxidoreductase [Deltaproteobacteria bacterium]
MSLKKKNNDLVKQALRHPLSRRTFMKAGAATAGVLAAGTTLLKPGKAMAANDAGTPDNLEIDSGVDVRYSVCLQCHSGCGIKVRVKDNTILKIDGNPWHPNCVESNNRLLFNAPVETGLIAKGTVCSKSQAGVEVMYNPFRLKQPLKRKGARGSGQWEAISWDQALTEIADRIRPYWKAYEDGTNINGQAALGTLANQVVFSPGRIEHGQKEFTDRVWKKAFGTVNARHDHTSICETTHHVAGDFLTEKRKHHFKPDTANAEYILWFGTNPLEANFPGQTLARRIASSTKAGVKHVIIDPRQSRAAAFAHRWLPVRMGGDAALAMGIGRRIIDQNKHDTAFLEAANNQAGLATANWDGSAKDKQYNNTDAGFLVVVKAPSKGQEWVFHKSNGKYVVVNPDTGAQDELDRDKNAAAQWGKIELDGTEPGTIAASTAGVPGVGDFVVDLGSGKYAAPAFQLYKARVFAKPLSWYATKSGIDEATITAVADEFAAAGRKASADAYRGGCQKTHGMATMQAILVLNNLVGNYDWKGGYEGGTAGHLHEMGGHAAGQLSLTGQSVNGRSPAGTVITRIKTFFDSDLAAALGEDFDKPTRRPWFPFAYNGVYQELIPSFEDAYPYSVGAFFSYWNNIPYSTPAAKEAAFRVLSDESLVPLHVNFDVEMSEMASLADYVLPDSTYLERWSMPHDSPAILSKLSGYRSPTAGYYAQKGYWDAVKNGTLDQWNYTIDWAKDKGPFAIEDILIELMSRVAGGVNAVPGFGDNAYYASHADLVNAGVSPLARNQLKTAWDWFWNALVNWAVEAGADPNDDAAVKAMVHQIAERGGWFQDTSDGQGNIINEYDGNYVKNRTKVGNYGKAFHFFFEYTYPSSHPDKAGERYMDPFARRYYDPLPAVVDHPYDSKGNPIDDGPDFAFDVVTYKPMYHAQGRTNSLPALTVIEPENFIEMNKADARRLDLWDGDFVKLTSASNMQGVKGRIKVTERIRPGVLAVSHSRGRWEAGSRAYRVDGTQVKADARRAKGLSINPVLRTDPVLGNVTLQDPIGGSASYYDTKVRVEKVVA